MSNSSDSEFDDLAVAIRSADSSGEDHDNVGINERETKTAVNLRNLKRTRNSLEEKELDKFLFGDKVELVKNLEGRKIFITDIEGSNVSTDIEKQTAVWHDSDDEGKQSSLGSEHKQQKKFERITGGPAWATLDKKKIDDDSDEDDDNISKTVGHVAKKETFKDFVKGHLNFKRLTNVNKTTKQEGRITSVAFHPSSTVGIVAGLKGMVSLFSIDGRENKKIHNIQYQKFPIYSCKLNNDSDELILGGLDCHYHTYNLLTGYKQRSRLPKGIHNLKSFQLSPCGNFMAVIGLLGEIHLLHSSTKELLCTMKQEYQSTAINFSQDSKKLFSHSDDNEVTVYNLCAQKIEHRFVDDGCVNGTSLTISPNGKFVATGSRQGFVNIYNYDDIFANKYPTPVKAISNLKTEITELKFNPTSEMLAICSAETDNAVKMIHFPSATVFSNFPSQLDNIGRATTVAFSPASGYFAVGTIATTVPLYRMQHYANY